MLNPIKNFLNYLQKNANGPNIFKATNDPNMSGDATNSALEGVDGENFEDPLTDPLAIDDPVVEIPTEVENVTIEKIIFVDIEKLKHKVKDGEKSKKIDENQKEVNDINGNNRNLHKVKEQKKPTKKKISSKEAAQAPNSNCDKESEAPADGASKSADTSSVISGNSGEETEEATDTSILLEEIRSDGSDSGLGSDSLRSISAIEKNLASLTPSKSSLKRRSADNLHEDQAKKSKRGINFGDVTVFYFPRCQGFGCVPTQGGSTLGMTAKHAYKKLFTLTEHAIEQRRLNRLKLAGNDLNTSSSSSDESKSDDEVSENSLSEGDNEAYGFLQPVTARQRRALLKAAGVRKIDTTEKDECRQLRTSREVCGCTCRGYCDPDTCECSQAGIKCQVDRLKPHEFPCGCTRDGCANVNGRIEFNPARVKTHFIHTIMRLELEKRSEDSSTATVIQNPKWWPQMRMQQSGSAGCSYPNYSYASPQYPPKIPPMSTIVGQESLDLHYAYRDEYSSMALNAENGANFTASADYYSTYNYSNLYPNGYQMNHPMQHPQTSYQHQLQPFNAGDCQYSNYTPTNGSSRYQPPRLDSSDAYTYHNGTPRINYPSTSTIPPGQEVLEGFCTLPPSSTSTIIAENQPTTASTSNESNENLSEIIKKSIVETVTA